MKNRRNYYRILHIQPDAPLEVIKASYRTLMGKLGCHPDLGGTHLLATLINNAYQCLSNAQKRAEYDCLLSLKKNKQSLSTGSPKYRSGTEDDSAMDSMQSKADKARPNRCNVCNKFSCSDHYAKSPEDDRRVRDRHKQKGTVTYTLPQSNNRYQGELMNLSPNGMQFISKERIDPTTDIKVGCALLFGTANVTNCREVLRDNRRMYINGIQFIMVEFYQSCGTFLSVKV